MTFILFPVGRRFFLDFAVNGPESADLVVGLYQNDYTPAVGDDGSAIVNATFPGYVEVTILHGDFPPSSMVGDEAVSTTPVTPTYDCTGGGGQTVYGVWVSESAGGLFLGAGRFDTPLLMIPGARLVLSPFSAVLPLP